MSGSGAFSVSSDNSQGHKPASWRLLEGTEVNVCGQKENETEAAGEAEAERENTAALKSSS